MRFPFDSGKYRATPLDVLNQYCPAGDSAIHCKRDHEPEQTSGVLKDLLHRSGRRGIFQQATTCYSRWSASIWST
jgi:hypothetical protein